MAHLPTPGRTADLFFATDQGELIRLPTDAAAPGRVSLEDPYGGHPLIQALAPLGDERLVAAGNEYLWFVARDLSATQRIPIEAAPGFVTALAVLGDGGTLVLGTPAGLLCLDRSDGWRPHPVSSSPLRVRSLLFTGNELVVGTRGAGLASSTWKGGGCSGLTPPRPLPLPAGIPPEITALTATADRLLVGLVSGKLLSRPLPLGEEATWTTVLEPPPAPEGALVRVVPDSNGGLWVAFEKALALIDADGRVVRRLSADDGLDPAGLSSLFVVPERNLLWSGRTVACLEQVRPGPHRLTALWVALVAVVVGAIVYRALSCGRRDRRADSAGAPPPAAKARTRQANR